MGLREVKIKTGTVRRLSKEYASYQKEAEKQTARIEKLKAENADEHDVRKQHEVLDETLQMIPDCKKRLEQAYGELKDMLEQQSEELNGSEEKDAAEAVLTEVQL